jgi:hypothetical protein
MAHGISVLGKWAPSRVTKDVVLIDALTPHAQNSDASHSYTCISKVVQVEVKTILWHRSRKGRPVLNVLHDYP